VCRREEAAALRSDPVEYAKIIERQRERRARIKRERAA
jgi:hypothetical protein